jgi:molecular chaperone GrpE (heat shock protein)
VPRAGAYASDLRKVIRSGDRRRSLEAIRDRLATELQDAEGRDVAPIAKELRAVIDQLDRSPGGKEVSKRDELAARRARRLADAKSR